MRSRNAKSKHVFSVFFSVNIDMTSIVRIYHTIYRNYTHDKQSTSVSLPPKITQLSSEFLSLPTKITVKPLTLAALAGKLAFAIPDRLKTHFATCV